MGEVFFYHLTQRPLEVTLRILLEKCRAQGWRVAVRGRTDAMLQRLDDHLWLHPEDGFLPHGLANGPHDGDQPILLTTAREAPNRPDCLISVEGADLAADEIGPLARAMVLFDGHDPTAEETARAQWKALTGSGIAAKYWSEQSGKWEMKAEKGG